MLANTKNYTTKDPRMRIAGQPQALATHAVVQLIFLFSSIAQAEPVDFWTNRTSDNCVFEDTGDIAGSVRLSP